LYYCLFFLFVSLFLVYFCFFFFFFSSRRRHTRWPRDWSSDVCSSDLVPEGTPEGDALLQCGPRGRYVALGQPDLSQAAEAEHHSAGVAGGPFQRQALLAVPVGGRDVAQPQRHLGQVAQRDRGTRRLPQLAPDRQ